MTSVASERRPAPQYLEEPFIKARVYWPSPVLNVKFDQTNAAIWVQLESFAPKHVSTQLLVELDCLSTKIREGKLGAARYKIVASQINKVFSLGGDLALFLRLINARDHDRLVDYGTAAIQEVWANITGYGRRKLTTIALVEGEAQGGGFEAALSCHIIVAECGTHFGFPESLFGLFPGMGALPLLAARTDEAVAERLVSSANRYSAEFLHDIGIVDFLVPAGEGRDFVKSITASPPTVLMEERKTQLGNITYGALLESVTQWVDTAVNLNERHKRSMRYLLNAQRRAGLWS